MTQKAFMMRLPSLMTGKCLSCLFWQVKDWQVLIIIFSALQHHPTKTKVMFIASSYNLINKIGHTPILMNNTPVPRTRKYTWLGMDIDEKLTWDAHIDSICSKVSVGIGAMKRINPFVPPATLQTIYKALIQPYFDYCSPLWDTCGLWKNTPR
jgi:hypothetical protein